MHRGAEGRVELAQLVQVPRRHVEAHKIELCVAVHPHQVAVDGHRRHRDGIEDGGAAAAQVNVGGADALKRRRQRAQVHLVIQCCQIHGFGRCWMLQCGGGCLKDACGTKSRHAGGGSVGAAA